MSPRPDLFPSSTIEPEFSVTALLPNDAGAIMEQLDMRIGADVIGSAVWHADGSSRGVAQILSLTIDPLMRRQGHGKRLLDRVAQQIQARHREKHDLLRRVWIAVRQKENVIGRSFLTKCGFNHVSTLRDLYPDQDGLIYLRSFD